ncbi:MAG: carbamoyltransferase [Tannerellaceae bacterium]|jgi:carbamoyltransferase|nr:carbamoyltransferase [Tannerellaceae bacterium]
MQERAVLGISAYYHDSAAALVIDGKIIAAAQEERFTRKKHDNRFPSHATAYVMEEAGLSFDDLSAVVFYDKPLLKFERLLETYHAFAPSGIKSFIKAMPVWIKGKLFAKNMLLRELKRMGATNPAILFSEHHLSHAASAFYPSPFEEAAILTIDGAGEWATATIGIGRREKIRILKEMHFPHSVGLLYSSFTYYLGFKVNSGEYKLMGLAPYGDRDCAQTQLFKAKIFESLVDLRADGSIILNMQYFNFAAGLKMINERKWHNLFGLPRREPESEITSVHANLASAIQQVTEEIILRLAATTRQLTGSDNLVLAGGVALNCVANGKIAASGLFNGIWIQPAAGDAGCALGAALACYHIYFGRRRCINKETDGMEYGFLGPSYTNKIISKKLNRLNAAYHRYDDYDRLVSAVSKELSAGKIIGWFQGRMEFGPRALGNRSILADPRNPDIQKRINMEIKQREEFRPFAPAVLEEDAAEYFSLKNPSPYMLFVTQLNDKWKISSQDNSDAVYEKLYNVRSPFPAVTHVDYSARVQTVSRESNPRFWRLLCSFKEISGASILLNTSFNVRGEPMVCTPEEAYYDFVNARIDCLVIGDYLLYYEEQNIGNIEKLIRFDLD